MFKNLTKYFDDFLQQRTTEICNETFHHHDEYKRLNERLLIVLNRMLEVIPVEHRHLLLEYEECEHQQTMITAQTAYVQGVIDGVQSSRYLKEVQNDACMFN